MASSGLGVGVCVAVLGRGRILVVSRPGFSPGLTIHPCEALGKTLADPLSKMRVSEEAQKERKEDTKLSLPRANSNAHGVGSSHS